MKKTLALYRNLKETSVHYKPSVMRRVNFYVEVIARLHASSMFPCFAGKYSCAGGGRGFYDSPRAFKNAPSERRGISNILSHISVCAKCILVVLVLVEIKAIKNARGSKATAGHRDILVRVTLSRRVSLAMKSGIRCKKTQEHAARVASTAEIKLISRRVLGMLFTHPRSPTVALICPVQRVITAPIYVQVSHREIFKGTKAIAISVSATVPAFRYLPCLVFFRVYRVSRALLKLQDYSCVRLRWPLEIVH